MNTGTGPKLRQAGPQGALSVHPLLDARKIILVWQANSS